MLKINGLSVYYGARCALANISLELRSGEVVALIGPNGSGKSTLVRAVSGVVPVRSGKVSIDGVDVLTMQSMLRARHLAVVPQVPSLPPAFAVLETVMLGRTPYLNFLGQASCNDEEIARSALQKVHALDLADRRLGELSGGEQQRVLLARALAQTTPILLLDEPTAHLDLQYQIGLMDIIFELAHHENMAILTALHDLNLAARYADRMILLLDGEIIATGTARQVLTPEIIFKTYHQPVRVIPHPFSDIPLVLP